MEDNTQLNMDNEHLNQIVLCIECQAPAYQCVCRRPDHTEGFAKHQERIVATETSPNSQEKETHSDLSGSWEVDSKIPKEEEINITESSSRLDSGARSPRPWHGYEETETTPLVESSGDTGSSSGGKKFCQYCMVYGHYDSTCFQQHPCKGCGKYGHNIKSCRTRSNSKKNKGTGDRGSKSSTLVSESFSKFEDETNSKFDNYEDEIAYLKEVAEDKKDEEETRKNTEEERAKYVNRFNSKNNRYVPLTFLESMKEEFVPHTTHSQPEEDGSEESNGSYPTSGSEVPLLVSEGSEDNEERSVDMNPLKKDFEFMPFPEPPTKHVDEYDEDPASYTFTSRITFPDYSDIIASGKKLFSWNLMWFLAFSGLFFLFCVLVAVPVLIGAVSWLFFPLFVTYTFFGFAIIGLFGSFFGLVAVIAYNVLHLIYTVVKTAVLMIKWKNTYTFLKFMDRDLIDLRTDNQMRSDARHKDACYALIRYSRRLHVCYSEHYKDTGFWTILMSQTLVKFILWLGKMIPNWLVEYDRTMVVSLEIFDQVKAFENVDFNSSDANAAAKITTAMKKHGTTWVNRTLKVDVVYTTNFLVWAYFKHQQQKTQALPFHRAPLTI